MVVTWFGEEGHTYTVERSSDKGLTWIILDTHQVSPYSDPDGFSTTLYRVRDTLGGAFTPAFYGAPEAAMCKVFGWIKEADGTPLEDQTVYVTAKEKEWYHCGALVAKYPESSVGTDSSGYWSIDLPQGLPVHVVIQAAELKRDIVIPYLSEASLASLL